MKNLCESKFFWIPVFTGMTEWRKDKKGGVMPKSFLYSVLFAILLFSCSCLRKKQPDFPKKELEEIITYGWYLPADPRRLEKLKQQMIEGRDLKEGEIFEKKYPHYLDYGDEKFNFSGRSYCYNKEKNKKAIYREDLRIRLYDKNGNLLAEDFLRLEFPENYDEEGRYSEAYMKREYAEDPWLYDDEGNYSEVYIELADALGTWTPESWQIDPEDGVLDYRSVDAYLPYHPEGHETRIVRLEGDKEIVLSSGVVYSKSYLIEKYTIHSGPGVSGWNYNEESQCHH